VLRGVDAVQVALAATVEGSVAGVREVLVQGPLPPRPAAPRWLSPRCLHGDRGQVVNHVHVAGTSPPIELTAVTHPTAGRTMPMWHSKIWGFSLGTSPCRSLPATPVGTAATRPVRSAVTHQPGGSPWKPIPMMNSPSSAGRPGSGPDTFKSHHFVRVACPSACSGLPGCSQPPGCGEAPGPRDSRPGASACQALVASV
jgi:hypothetical protein